MSATHWRGDRGEVPEWARRRIRSALVAYGREFDARDVAALARRTGLSKGLARACLALDAFDARSAFRSSRGPDPSRVVGGRALRSSEGVRER